MNNIRDFLARLLSSVRGMGEPLEGTTPRGPAIEVRPPEAGQPTRTVAEVIAEVKATAEREAAAAQDVGAVEEPPKVEAVAEEVLFVAEQPLPADTPASEQEAPLPEVAVTMANPEPSSEEAPRAAVSEAAAADEEEPAGEQPPAWEPLQSVAEVIGAPSEPSVDEVAKTFEVPPEAPTAVEETPDQEPESEGPPKPKEE